MPKRYTTETIIEQFKKKNKHNFDYSYSEYIDMQTDICVICPTHGDIWLKPFQILRNCCCPKCREEKLSKLKITNEQFIEKGTKIHNGKYVYNKTEYNGIFEKVCIICPIHGEFWQEASSHLSGCGCPKCVGLVSKAEEEIKQFILENFNIEILSNNRDILSDGKELDIYIPSLKVAFEYNGMIWHSERFGRNKDYHLNKTIDCLKQGIKLYHIYEYEWLNKKTAVKNNILQILRCAGNYSTNNDFNNKISLITEEEAKEFLDLFDVQGFTVSDLYVGCFIDKKLVSVLSLNKGKTKDEWQITRFTTEYNSVSITIQRKLFSYFIENYKPLLIEAIVDRRWSNGELFEELGFQLIETLPVTFAYTRSPNEYLTALKIEREGFYKIWNCGYLKLQWKSVEFT